MSFPPQAASRQQNKTAKAVGQEFRLLECMIRIRHILLRPLTADLSFLLGDIKQKLTFSCNSPIPEYSPLLMLKRRQLNNCGHCWCFCFYWCRSDWHKLVFHQHIIFQVRLNSWIEPSDASPSLLAGWNPTWCWATAATQCFPYMHLLTRREERWRVDSVLSL